MSALRPGADVHVDSAARPLVTQSGHSVDCEVQQVGTENQGFPYSTLQTAAHQPGQAYARAVVLGEELEAAGFGIDNLESMYLPSTPRFAGFNYWGSARPR